MQSLAFGRDGHLYAFDLIPALHVRGVADGVEPLRGERVPSLGRGVVEVVGVAVDAVAEVVAPQPVPETLDGVQLRRVGREEQRRDVARPHDFGARVPARAIEHQHDVHALAARRGTHMRADPLEVLVHPRDPDRAGDHAHALARPGAHRAVHVDRLVLGLLDRRRSRASPRPHRRQRALLPDAGLVLVPDFDDRARVVPPEPLDKRGAFVVNVSCATASALRCRGRGLSAE